MTKNRFHRGNEKLQKQKEKCSSTIYILKCTGETNKIFKRINELM